MAAFGDLDPWFQPDFRIVAVVLRSFANMDASSIFTKGVVAVEPENETALLKDLRAHFIPRGSGLRTSAPRSARRFRYNSQTLIRHDFCRDSISSLLPDTAGSSTQFDVSEIRREFVGESMDFF